MDLIEPIADDLVRPEPPRNRLEDLRLLVRVVGPARIAAWGVAALLAVFAGWWLLKAPPTPVEDGLPVASGGITAGPDATDTTIARAADPVSGRVVVHVAGAVRRPGLYRLGGDARVGRAIERAGGAVEGADLDAVNLAAVVVDGQQVYVPTEGEVGGGGAPDASGGAPAVAGPVDLNRASAEALDALPGVGPSTAAAIIRQREENGPFATIDDLLDVPGIGPAKLAALQGLVTV